MSYDQIPTITAMMTLVAPLHHSEFGKSESNAIGVRRMPVLSPDEGIVQVPVVSGNALRGRMRRMVMRDLLDLSGLEVGQPGYDRIYAAVANGGTLTGSDNIVDPVALRQMRKDCPPLSLFGAALYNYMLPGRMQVGICWPASDVTRLAGLVPDSLFGPNAVYLDWETSYVRLPEKERQRTDQTKVGPMPYTVEAIPAGATLVSDIRFDRSVTDLERSCAAWALDRIDALGGKGGIGMGRLEMRHDGNPQIYDAWRRDAPRVQAARAVLEAI